MVKSNPRIRIETFSKTFSKKSEQIPNPIVTKNAGKHHHQSKIWRRLINPLNLQTQISSICKWYTNSKTKMSQGTKIDRYWTCSLRDHTLCGAPWWVLMNTNVKGSRFVVSLWHYFRINIFCCLIRFSSSFQKNEYARLICQIKFHFVM